MKGPVGGCCRRSGSRSGGRFDYRHRVSEHWQRCWSCPKKKKKTSLFLFFWSWISQNAAFHCLLLPILETEQHREHQQRCWDVGERTRSDHQRRLQGMKMNAIETIDWDCNFTFVVRANVATQGLLLLLPRHSQN